MLFRYRERAIERERERERESEIAIEADRERASERAREREPALELNPREREGTDRLVPEREGEAVGVGRQDAQRRLHIIRKQPWLMWSGCICGNQMCGFCTRGAGFRGLLVQRSQAGLAIGER